MTLSALVIDREALGPLDAAFIEPAWFESFAIPPNTDGLRRVERNGVVFLLGAPIGEESGLLVVDLRPDGPLLGLAQRRLAFERILRVALRHFDRNVALPVQWQVYHENSRLSIYAQPLGGGARNRIYFDQAPAGDGNIFAYGMTDAPRSLGEVPPDIELYEKAQGVYQDAALEEMPSTPPTGSFSIILTEPLGYQLAGSGTLEDWYERRLSTEQVAFVDKPLNRPIRLRGAAGTGKTQSMAVKCLRELYASHDAGQDKRFAFLTHSSALAHEVVRGMLLALDPTERFSTLLTTDGQPKLWIGTLYELAQEQLGYEAKGLRPLSLDGREGRELQRMMIDEAIDKVRRDPLVVSTMLKQTPDLADRLRHEDARTALIEELMNEFACVLDAENVRLGTETAEAYVKARREGWQMHLPNMVDRQVVLEIHHSYRNALKAERLLGMDQMVADFDRYLVTHEWEQLRDGRGFDVIFVDEYHYFTRVEAMTLHNLFKQHAGCDGCLPLIMAYDLKQSTSDAGLGGGMTRFRNPGVGESVEVALNQVFRSTPQIAAFLEALDGSFPALDLEGEFHLHPGKSAKEDGPWPTLASYDTDTKLVDSVFRHACERARVVSGGGTQVAVLCLNEQLFDAYRKASRIADKHVAITTREDMRELRYARTRCVFSMPEFVAGLQFDTVFLIHADDVDLADTEVSQGARRRYVSRIYLGASRAANRLHIATSAKRGGVSAVLAAPIQNGTLRSEES
jgi:hypothetical protein